MLKQYTLRMPGAVFGGENSLDNLTNLVKDTAKVAVFTDKGIEATGLADLVTAKIGQAGKEYVVFDELPAEPSYQQAQAAIDAFKASGADFIVAVGGGSVMDIAKLASLLKTTPNAIVAVPEKEVKIGIVNPEMIADYVILDPIMIKKLPRKIAASTGVDALCHAIECWTSNKANAFSDMYAMWALDLILNNIEKACDDPEAVQAKINMQTASFYAGVAITASGTTAVHALSYPMGGKYHVAHGVANAILLVPVMRFNESVCREKFAEAYDRCVHGEKTCTTVEEKSAYILRWLEEIVKHLDIPTSYKGFGVKPEDLDGLVEAGMQQQRLLVNNMRPVTAEDARNIYLEVI